DSPAISATRVTIAFTFGFTRSICFRCAASASRADSFFMRINCAISTALIKQTDESEACACRVGWKRGTAAIPSRTSRRVGYCLFMARVYHFKTRLRRNRSAVVLFDPAAKVSRSRRKSGTQLEQLDSVCPADLQPFAVGQGRVV